MNEDENPLLSDFLEELKVYKEVLSWIRLFQFFTMIGH